MNFISIVPTLFANSIDEMIKEYKLLQHNFTHYHIDIMKDDFVEHSNLEISNSHQMEQFDLLLNNLNNNSHTAEIHLMVKNIHEYLDIITSYKCVSSIIIHYESFSSVEELLYIVEHVFVKYPNISFQLAINPDIVVEDIITIISNFSKIMVMGVTPGKQGQEFQEDRINVISLLLKLGVNVSIDGGLNEGTISKILRKIQLLNIPHLKTNQLNFNEIHSNLQLNIGSYFNQAKNEKQLQSRITTIDNQLNLYTLKKEEQIHSNPYIVILDIGGTHTKLYVGLFDQFKIEEIQVFYTNEFRTSKELFQKIIKTIGVHTLVDYLIVGVAGEKHTSTIHMTHQNLMFDLDTIKQEFTQFREILLFNDCELAGYGVRGSQEYLNFIENNFSSNISNKTSKKISNKASKKISNNIELNSVNNLNKNTIDEVFLELLVVIGTGVGIAHISNEGISYNSQGGHIITQFEDMLYTDFLHKELGKEEVTFDDLISARGLEMRYLYDNDEYKSTYEIIQLAKQKDSKVSKTINFYLKELYYFLQDCIYFDNIITNLHLGGDFLAEIVDLFKIYKEKEFFQLQSKCNIIVIKNNYLQFLGALQIIHQIVHNNIEKKIRIIY